MKASYIHTKAEKQSFPAFSFSVLQKIVLHIAHRAKKRGKHEILFQSDNAAYNLPYSKEEKGLKEDTEDNLNDIPFIYSLCPPRPLL